MLKFTWVKYTVKKIGEFINFQKRTYIISFDLNDELIFMLYYKAAMPFNAVHYLIVVGVIEVNKTT